MTERSILYIPTSNMIWDKRVFTLKPAIVEEIKKSIVESGQLQPIVVIPGQPAKLVIGRHRYQAVKELYHDNPLFVLFFLGQPCPPGTIPALDINDAARDQLLAMEIAENVYRMNLSWPERCQALAQLHKVEEERFEEKKAAGEVPPDATYKLSDTARKLVDATGGNEIAALNRISQSLILANHLDDKEIAGADSPKAAFNKLRQKLTLEASLLTVDYDGETPHTLLVEDTIDVLVECFTTERKLPNEPFDLTLADPPYGIGADTYDNMAHHKYDDSWTNAREVYQAIAHLAMATSHERANLMLFCTPERWHDVRDIAEAAGWVSWPRPIVWAKSNEGMRPWGQSGLAYTYECIYWGTKGQRGLNVSANDILAYYKTKSSEREHAASKPVDLYARLLELATIPGDTVFDPCVGSGTTYKAAMLRNVVVTGIESNEEVAQIARKNLHWKGESDAKPDRVEPAPAITFGLGDL